MGDGVILKYFKEKEFDCACCGKNLMEPEFLFVLDQVRHVAGIPFIVNSGYRCPHHNKDVGGTPGSAHVSGYAADIKAITADQQFKIVSAALKVGINRIGVAKTYIHLDADPAKNPERLWSY